MRPPELQAIFDEIERGGPYRSVEELNRLLADRVREYNARPQADFGGLSPDQMQQLFSGDWHESGALRVREDLTLVDLADVPFLVDARTLLRYVADAGVVKETPARNLTRAVVAELLPQLRMPAQRRAALGLEAGPRNEQDVLWLPDLRFTLLIAGLLVRRKGLRASRLGRELLRDASAGVLYALLFRTFFQRFDLRALSGYDTHPGLQATIAYSFYRLGATAREWASPESLAQTSWLASAKDPPTISEIQYGDLSYIAFQRRVLEPLVQFGLVEERVIGVERGWKETLEYRVSPLFDRVLTFHFER